MTNLPGEKVGEKKKDKGRESRDCHDGVGSTNDAMI